VKILLTGGMGFLGTHIRRRLQKEGMEVVLFDRSMKGSHNYEEEVFQGDIRDKSSVKDAVARVEGVIHLAGILGTQECIQDPYPAVETNIIGGLNVLEAVSHYKVPAVFNGVGNHFMDNTYSITKTTIERFINMYNAERGARVNLVRLVNAYGPGQTPAAPYGPSKVRKVVPSFICRALAHDPIEVYGEGDQIADMVWAGDVAEATLRALRAAENGNIYPAIEVGPEAHVTVLELAEFIKELTSSDSEIVHLPQRPGEAKRDVVADTSTMEVIDFSPDDLMPLREGMIETIRYYQ